MARAGRDAFPRLPSISEIIGDVPGTFKAIADRVEVQFPRPGTEPATRAALAHKLADHDRVLAIVHRRDDARDLCRLMPDEVRVHGPRVTTVQMRTRCG